MPDLASSVETPLQSRQYRPLLRGEAEVIYLYVGDGRAVPALPARDLTADDLAEVLAREGIGEDVVVGCGLYEPTPLNPPSRGEKND